MEGRDVTERREQEAMLAQAQKMEAVGQLTSGVAHDFNNLLMVIVGNLELLAARPGTDSRTKARVEKALEAISRGKALTHQLLAFSRKQELKPSPLDVNQTLRGMSEMLKSTSPNVDVILELSDDLPRCRVDANQLETTILNLAVNARDAMGGGGRLTISTGSGAVDRQYRAGFVHLPPGEYVRLEVSDTGHGIAPQHMAHLFEPFFTTKPPDKGTGLGLAMVYGFVKQSGGDIKVHSEVGKGTTFRIYLPTADTPTGSDMTDCGSDGGLIAVPGERRHRPRVLVVEDEHDVREVAVTTLSDLGYDVEQAPDGDTAVAYFRMGRSYDLLITDIVMAGEHDGASVALMARSQYPEIGVVFASSFPQRALERAEGRITGARFLTKPFSVDDLTRTARAALGTPPPGRRQAEPTAP
jgi:nitrogen-specific signal transduction histidine kinase/CheY-like chemotaxis protein